MGTLAYSRNVYKRKNGTLWTPNPYAIPERTQDDGGTDLWSQTLDLERKGVVYNPNEDSNIWIKTECFQQGFKLLDKALGYGACATVELGQILKYRLQADTRMVNLVKKFGSDKVAIKVIDKCRAMREYEIKFIEREKKVMALLRKSDKIVSLYEAFESRTRLYLVMEYCVKGDLLSHVNKFKEKYGTGLPEKQVKRIFRQICEGVHECHSKKIVHRDLKSENILLDRHLNAKLSDFGFSCERKATLLSTYCGSYAYAAPEVVANRPYLGEMADVWSLGVILHVMATGMLPFTELNEMDIAQQEQRLHFPETLATECKLLIRKILQYDPKLRPSVADILKDSYIATVIATNTKALHEQEEGAGEAIATPRWPGRPITVQKTSFKPRSSSKFATVTLRQSLDRESLETVRLKSLTKVNVPKETKKKTCGVQLRGCPSMPPLQVRTSDTKCNEESSPRARRATATPSSGSRKTRISQQEEERQTMQSCMTQVTNTTDSAAKSVSINEPILKQVGQYRILLRPPSEGSRVTPANPTPGFTKEDMKKKKHGSVKFQEADESTDDDVEILHCG